ncbi:hypothetical protein TPHA_0M00520 [Tetrapisispora phaffii CBS 4417]|uniref:Large ribosomal subunit protein mL59 domain-containing protein n=1 Tax=Tetrapisispora phaffii (strain ATCC 24235 / CBS 4417 / NBRC 1672 / NRRL Y-8282 / UCD 70-5) TaxID=1071381 RepID=G8C0B2_TETPH|nr:mitochondrial 54S ribosomal protein YmL25 TPHA_0M00520 [Tetrapisispora phaffii CBS 4417]CCE65627.1 hypothetical protein TPHA_0M00520 [Tetrapisispora phaffii CBS 4417]
MSVNSNVKLFELLPKQLKNFFKKYPPSVKYADRPVSTHSLEANPFYANKHPVTGRYHDPKFSLRRMSVLYKTAYLYGVHTFLPPMKKKFFEDKYENKKFMRGVLNPKGHKHELLREGKLAKMEEAIKNADNYIIEAKGSKYAKKLEKRRAEKQKSWF